MFSETNGVPTTTHETHNDSKDDFKPIGVRILGEVDPRKMTEQQFKQNPELLFHGSAKPVDFSHNFDYRSSGYLEENDGSSTLGDGFYTTDNLDDAKNYSQVRKRPNEKDTEPVVAEILPFKAKVLDLRQAEDPTQNGAVPRELAERWRDKFLDYYKNRTPRQGPTAIYFEEMERDYSVYLGKLLRLEKFDLRILLGTANNSKLGWSMHPAPLWSKLFREFMVEQGYDGLVYNEGGEGEKGKKGVSYVFYNLSKIGTQESWEKRKDTD